MAAESLKQTQIFLLNMVIAGTVSQRFYKLLNKKKRWQKFKKRSKTRFKKNIL